MTWYLGDFSTRWGPFAVDAYTAPALFMALLAIVGGILLNTVFDDTMPPPTLGRGGYAPLKHAAAGADEEDHACRVGAGDVHRDDNDRETENGQKTQERDDMDLRFVASWTEVDWCILAGLLLNVATKGSVGVFETMGVGVATQSFGMTPSAAGFVVSCCGAIGVTTLLYNKPMVEAVHDTGLMVGGVLVMVVACLCMLHSSTGAPWQFALSIFAMYAVGYPIGHTAVLTWFSRLSEQASEGFLQGWFGSAGSVGRILLPAASGFVAEYLGYNVLFLVLAGFLLLTWLSIFCNYSLFTRLTV